MSTRSGGLPPRRRRTTVLVLAFTFALIGLAAAGPAFAADGVRVIPLPVATPDPGQLEPAISGDILAYTSTPPVAADSDDSYIALKYLGDGSAPYIIARPAGYKDMSPAILDDGGTIYVIWTRLQLAEPWTAHLMIWKGTYGMPIVGGANTFIPDDTYPKTFIEGPDQTPLPVQGAASIGLVTRGAEQHVVAAWQDSRDTVPGVPEVFWLDLTEEPSWDPASAGVPVDSTGVLGRGQYLPTVGATGVFWLDDRFSWWDDGNLTDTAVYRMDMATLEPAYYFRDTDHSYDNGSEFGPQTIANGAMWLRTGPYGSGIWVPFVKPLSGSTRTLSPIVQPLGPATFTRAGASSSGVAIAGKHANSAASADWDIFYYDSTAGVQVPVCDRHVPVAADQEFKNNQFDAVIGNGFSAYRVVWVDQRESVNEDSTDAKLYEAFVPTVLWTLRPSTILNLRALRTTVTVKPDFTGEPVKLQRVTPVRQLGRTYYKPYGRGYLATATMVAGSPNSGSSVASLKWTPTAKGTYYLRMWFPGAAKYTYDGQTIATGKMVAVPTVGNYSKIIKITVK
jgi:hypothetical protein